MSGIAIGAKVAKAIGIRGGLAIGASLALAFVMWRAEGISQERDGLKTWQDDAVAMTRVASGEPDLARSAVIEQIDLLGQDVDLLKSTIDGLNDEALERAAEYEASITDASREAEQFRRQARTSQRRINTLALIAEKNGEAAEQCEVPAELLEALEGL